MMTVAYEAWVKDVDENKTKNLKNFIISSGFILPSGSFGTLCSFISAILVYH